MEAIVVLVHDGGRIVGSRCDNADGAEGGRALEELPARHGRAVLLAVLLAHVDLKVLVLWHLAHPDEAFALGSRHENANMGQSGRDSDFADKPVPSCSRRNAWRMHALPQR